MPISSDEFNRAIAGLDGQLQTITRHLEKLNGRTETNALELVRVAGRVTNIEEKLLDHPNRRKEDQGQGASWAEATVTKREGALIGLGLAILVGVLRVLEVTGTKLWHVLMSAKP